MFSIRAVLVDIFLRRFKVPRDMVRFAFRRYPSRTAIMAPRGRLTYSQLEERVLSLAGGLTALGINKGDFVFTMLPDDWEQVETRLAAYELGAVQTAFHASHPVETVVRAAQMVRPSLFIYDPQIGAEAAEYFSQAMPDVQLVATGANARYERLINAHAPYHSPEPLAPTDPAGLGFTSGTTGQPKAMFVNQGVGVISLRMVAKNVGVTPGEIHMFLVGIPLVGAGSGIVLPTLFSGSTLLIPNAYEADEFLRQIQTHQVTRMFTTPSLLIDLLERPSFNKTDLPSLRNIIYGTAPTPAAKLAEAIRRLGPIFQQGYGMAEVLPPVSLLQMQDHMRDGQVAPRHILSSVGRVVPGVKVQIVDEADHPLPTGKIGQVLIASPTMFSGYWQRPDLTEQALQNGWMHTKDYGYFDAEGWLHILDRSHDLIKRDKHVIYPRLVEEIIHDHPCVKEACLVGLGEPATTILCLSLWREWQAQLTSPNLPEELRQYLATRLEPWQVPDQILILKKLPRSYLCKVLRREVRETISQQMHNVN